LQAGRPLFLQAGRRKEFDIKFRVKATVLWYREQGHDRCRLHSHKIQVSSGDTRWGSHAPIYKPNISNSNASYGYSATYIRYYYMYDLTCDCTSGTRRTPLGGL